MLEATKRTIRTLLDDGRLPAYMRPGTLTITYGQETVVLDPLDPQDKFEAAKARIDQILKEAGESR